MAIQKPRFLVKTSDISNPKDGESLVTDGVNYLIRVPMDDGTGFTELVLERQ